MISVRYGEPENRPTTVQTNAVSEYRSHDLRIMRPTLYQLRYRRHVPEPTEIFADTKLELFESAAKRAGELGGCAMDNGTKKPWDDGQSDSGPWGNRQWDTGTMKMGEQAKGTRGFWETGTVGQRSNRTMGHWTMGQWDNGLVNN